MRPVLVAVGTIAEAVALLLAITADTTAAWGGALFGVLGGVLFFTAAALRIMSDRRQVNEYREDVDQLQARVHELTQALLDCEQRKQR